VSGSVRDRRLFYAAAFLRATGAKYSAVVLAFFLSTTEIDAWVASAGLAGVALATLLVTTAGRRLSPRAVILGSGVLGAAGAVALSFATSSAVAAVACFVGMVNAMGRDRTASLAVESALLPSTASDRERTRTFAWHAVWQDTGNALGGLLAGVAPAVCAAALGGGTSSGDGGDRVAMGIAGAFALAAVVPYLFVSPHLAAPQRKPDAPLSPESRRILVRICALFGLDGLGGGFLATTLLSYFFLKRFDMSKEAVGLLTAAGAVLNAVSHLGAAWLARRIGLVRTMVFTHLPSSLLLASVPFAPSFGVAAVLYLLREGLVEMDVPTRQSYVMAVLRPEERTTAAGATLLVRLFSYVVGPLVAAPLLASEHLAVPLWIGAGAKVVYDLLLWRSFRRLRPPEELGP